MITQKLIKISDLPSPNADFIVGHLKQFNVYNKHQVLENWAKQLGKLYKINFVGKVFVVSADADVNHQILKMRPEKFKRLPKINQVLLEMGVNGVFNAEGENWKRQRKPITEALNVKNLKSYYPILKSNVEILLNKIDKYEHNILEVQSDFMSFTIDVTTEIAFGIKLNTLLNKENDFQKSLETIFPMINSRVTAPIPLWKIIKNKKDKKLDQSLVVIKNTINDFIYNSKLKLEKNHDLRENPSNFLESLLSDSSDVKFTDEEIYGNIFTMLMAGEDTTSNSLSWAFYYLAQHPKIVSKVREEALEVYHNEKSPKDYDQLMELSYANSVAQEAIRLKSTSPQLYVECNEDVLINDFEIPKGTQLILQTQVAQSNNDNFFSANEFIPERWMKAKCPFSGNHQPMVVKSFGSGPRFCPGKNLALNEMTIVISVLCKYFDLELASSINDIKEKFEFTMYPENLKIKFQSV